jgi:hypothetical protein
VALMGLLHSEAETIAAQTERFMRDHAPNDPHERIDFERRLHYLIHSIYREAQAPLIDRMAQAMAFAPPPIMVASK